MGLKRKGQWKIQQMAFMILAIFVLFVFAGLFMISFYVNSIKDKRDSLLRDEAISSIKAISSMSELNCDSKREFCIDEDKLRFFSGNLSRFYSDFWHISSVRVFKIYPSFEKPIRCPMDNCNYYEVFRSKNSNFVEYSAYVNICKKIREGVYVYEKCEIGKILVGVKDA